jgi:outer membrane protein, heavy metal efflux system
MLAERGSLSLVGVRCVLRTDVVSAACIGLLTVHTVWAAEGCERLDRRNVVACVLRLSAVLRGELASQRVVAARRATGQPFLPSNPTLNGSLASRVGPDDRATNWSLTVAQEFEVAGQSALRVDVAQKEVGAQAYRFEAARRAVAGQAWFAYFSVLASQERLALAQTLEANSAGVAATARAMALVGLASEADVDVAETAALAAAQERFAHEGFVAANKAVFMRLAGLGPVLTVEGALEPLQSFDGSPSVQAQAAVLALEGEAQAAAASVALLQRERIPKPTISVFAQNDGFDERVFGVGLSLPIPLPHPVGRTNAGPIAEAHAVSERFALQAEVVRHELSAEYVAAVAALQAATKSVALYPEARRQRAQARLASLASQVSAARMPVRDALLVQQALVEQLKAGIDAHEAWCVASVRVGLATGQSLEGVSL